jgi:hypothetical protein
MNITFHLVWYFALCGPQCEKYHEVCTDRQCTAVRQNDKETAERGGGGGGGGEVEK